MLKYFSLLIVLLGSLISSQIAFAQTNTSTESNKIEVAQSAVEKQAISANAVNINQATVEQLQKILNGVGIKKAQAIVDYREKNGPFTSVEQLTAVPGIGNAILEKNRSLIRID